MEDDHQSPPPAVDEAHVQEKHATEDSHHSLPPAVDDLTPQEHTAEDAHDAAVPLIVDEEPTLETIVAHLLARLDSHPHEATPKLLQALLNAAVTTAMNSNVARDVSVAGSEESMGDVSETPTAVESRRKNWAKWYKLKYCGVSFGKIIQHYVMALWYSFGTNPYRLHALWYILMMTLLATWIFGGIAAGHHRALKSGDGWDLFEGTIGGFPAMVTFVLFMFPPLMVQF